MNNTSSPSIDHDSFIPYYVQVKEQLKHQIQEGVWHPGQRLPSEAELCEMYDISRTVVRQALQELEYEGLIYRRRGKGSFVAEPKVHERMVQKLTGFHQDMVAQGHTITNRVLRQEVQEATAKMAQALAVKLHAPLNLCERLRFVDGNAINVSMSHIPLERCPDLVEADLSNQSLYAFIEDACSQRIVRGWRTIEATLPTPHIAEMLEIEGDLPVFRITNICYLEDGTPIEHSCGYHRSDRIFFEVELLRGPEFQAGDASIRSDRLPQGYRLTDPSL